MQAVIFAKNKLMIAERVNILSKKLSLASWQVENALNLFSQGGTIPFVSRYRQERTGGMDEEELFRLQKEDTALTEFFKRRDYILNQIESDGKLTDELRKKIMLATHLSDLEDLYLPFKPKRKTKASVARENGLEPLAGILMKQNHVDITTLALRFVKENIPSVEDALEGARYIMAEWINERKFARNAVRRNFRRKAVITSKVVKTKIEEAENYRDYFDYSGQLSKIPGHRYLAMRRGESEGFLRIDISPPRDEVLAELEKVFVKNKNAAAQQVILAVHDAYKRLLKPSIETEFKNEHKEKADDEAIAIFALNLRQLLLAPPLGQKRIMGIDPGFRSGCKLVCLDEHGQLLHNETVYPHPPQRERTKAAAKISQLAESYKLDAIAIGNGTASRETEDLIRRHVRFRNPIEVFVVNEAGASVYSASAVARKEFPNYDVTVRGAVSIGRRLMDPLAELVKIDPKSIGVGQYQHDVDQNKLKQALDETVVSVVNSVGVELNTASEHLLAYVSGIGPTLAQRIVEYRTENGGFSSREELKNVKGLGPKAFEQSAGFLRIANAENPLDNSAVHPESYAIALEIASDLNKTISDLIGEPALRQMVNAEKYITKDFGLPTILNILDALAKLGRDPRGKAKVFSFDERLRSMEDLKPGMVVPGIITNIVAFGAFVDIGVNQDGLIHLSEMAHEFVSDPNTVVRLNQMVEVKVVEVDIPRKRIGLSLKK